MQTVPIPAPPEEPSIGRTGRFPEKYMVQQAAAPHPNNTGGPVRRQPSHRFSTGRPDHGSRSASYHCINRPSTQHHQSAQEDCGSVSTSGSPIQRTHSTLFSLQGQRHGQRRYFPGPRPGRSWLLSVPPAIQGQGAKVYTTVQLPPAGKRHRQALMAADACSTNSGRLFITESAT